MNNPAYDPTPTHLTALAVPRGGGAQTSAVRNIFESFHPSPVRRGDGGEVEYEDLSIVKFTPPLGGGRGEVVYRKLEDG